MTRKDEILQTARKILIEEGHYRLTLRNVAEQVGIKLASLQYHYPSKGDLVATLMQSSLATYHEIIRELIQSIVEADDASAIERLFKIYQDEQASGVFEQLWALSVQDPLLMAQYDEAYLNLWNVVSEVIPPFDPKADEEARRTRAALIIALLDGLETFVSSEQLRPLVPDVIHRQVVMLIKVIVTGESPGG